RDAFAGSRHPVGRVTAAGNGLPNETRGARPEQLTRARILRLAVGFGAGTRTDAGWLIEDGSARETPSLGKEIARLVELVVLRCLVDEPDAVVERQSPV